MTKSTPSLAQRLKPLVIFGSTVAAIRLALDATAPDFVVTMHFGLYYLMPVAMLVIGLQGRWGPVRWTTMAGTMIILGFVVWGVWNSIAYTTGQFMEWTHGRFYPGEGQDHEAARAAPPAATATAKIGFGLLHGLLSSITSSIWCIGFGTVLIWLPGRLRGSATT
jgi:hypothetical protein